MEISFSFLLYSLLALCAHVACLALYTRVVLLPPTPIVLVQFASAKEVSCGLYVKNAFVCAERDSVCAKPGLLWIKDKAGVDKCK